MVLNLRKIYTTPDKDVNIVVRNHHDQKMAFCCPGDVAYIDFSRWLYAWEGCTEINITSVYGRVATVQLEDDDKWGLVVSGNIEGGKKKVPVGGSRDFDVILTGDGHMHLKCWDDYAWGEGSGNSLDFVLVPFQQ